MEYLNIEEKSLELKKIISEYDKEQFVGFFSYYIRQQPDTELIEELQLFKSKLKDFQYLIALRFFDKTIGKKNFPPQNSILKELAERIDELKNAYILNDFSVETFFQDISYQEISVIHEFTFNNYFHNGSLSYVEQDIDLFEKMFKSYESIIVQNFDLDIDFLIDLYKFTEKHFKQQFSEHMQFTWDKEFIGIKEKAKLDSETFNQHIENLPEEVKIKFINFIDKPKHYSLMFSKTDYYKELAIKKVDSFLELFSCSEEDCENFLFYSDINPFDLKPIVKLSDSNYLNIYPKQLPIAYYNFFYRFCENKLPKEKMQKHRGTILENKCYDLLIDFFKNEKQTFFYRNYNLGTNFEQDILVISNGTAFIFETKASNFREPFRNMHKAFIRIKDDFKENIQKGFEQCQRVKDKFESGQRFKIFDKKGIGLHEINPQKIYNIFNIIVTQERLGPIQQNLGLLLKISEAQAYPYSIYINDLEIFLRALKIKTKNPRQELVTFLKNRELLHERIFCNDELDICAFYMSNKKMFLRLSNQLEATFTLQPECQDYFDELYYQGIGLLKNEYNKEEKKHSGYESNNEKLKAFRYPDFIEFE
jgi:hypothetical protein